MTTIPQSQFINPKRYGRSKHFNLDPSLRYQKARAVRALRNSKTGRPKRKKVQQAKHG